MHGGKEENPQLHSLALTKVDSMKSGPTSCSSAPEPHLAKATTVLPVGARSACGTHPASSLADKECGRQTSSNRGRTTYCKLGQNSEIPLEFRCPDQCSALKKPLIRKNLQKQKPPWHLNKQPVMGFALNCKAYLTTLLVPNKCTSLKIQLNI